MGGLVGIFNQVNRTHTVESDFQGILCLEFVSAIGNIRFRILIVEENLLGTRTDILFFPFINSVVYNDHSSLR